MPAPLIAAGITAGAGLLGNVFTNASTARQNKLQRQWNERMYAIQRTDALDDWNRQNEYNHPSAQMKRLREAGLNPNLIYENGATSPSASVRSASVDSWNPQPMKWDLGQIANNSLSAYFDTEIKMEQANNLRANNTVAMMESLLKAAQIVATNASTDKTKQDTKTGAFDLLQKQRLADISVEAAIAALKNTEAQTKSTLDENERRAAMQAPNLQKAAEDILLIRANRAKTQAERQLIYQQIENLKKDETLKQLDIEMRQMGLTPSDPWYFRVLNRLIPRDNSGRPFGSQRGDKVYDDMWKGVMKGAKNRKNR